MTPVAGLGEDLLDLAKALGLLDDGGNPVTAWFGDPLAHVQNILRDDVQRAGLFALIDSVLPPDASQPSIGGAWHPLPTGRSDQSNIFLTVDESQADAVVVGLAGRIVAAPAGGPSVDVQLQLGLVHAGTSSLRSVFATSESPLRVVLDVTFAGTSLPLEGARVELAIAPLEPGPPPPDVRVTLIGVQLGGSRLDELELDAAKLGSDAANALSTLLQQHLSELATASGIPPELAALAQNLPALIGLAEGLPRLPLEQLASVPGAFRSWIGELLDTAMSDGRSALEAWIGHIAGLLGAELAAAAGTPEDPWVVPLVALDGDGSASMTLSVKPGAAGVRDLLVGLAVDLKGPAHATISVVLAAFPLSGSGDPLLVPSASVTLAAPGGSGKLVDDAPTIVVERVRAGLRYEASKLAPLLELDGVTFEGQTYATLDLSSAAGARAAAADAVRDAILAALGAQDGAGRHLAALVGLVAPTGAPDATLIDPIAFVTAPTREIARVHLAALGEAAHGWGPLLGELASLIGLPGGVSGAGTVDEPWRVTLAQQGVVAVSLTAWRRDAAAGGATGLSLGLRASGATGPIDAFWLAELIGFDIPPAAAAHVRLIGSHQARVVVTGPFAPPSTFGIAVALQNVTARASWQPGSPLLATVTLDGISVADATSKVDIAHLSLPPATGFDGTAADLGLGVPAADVLALMRILVSRAALSFGGTPAFTFTGLIGMHGGLPGLPADWPLLELPASGGVSALLDDPLSAVRAWLAKIAREVDTDGVPFALHALGWLGRLLRGELPALVAGGELAPVLGSDPSATLEIDGVGTWADPWRIPLIDGGAADLLLWLDPDGPPSNWSSALVAAASEMADVFGAASRLPEGVGRLAGAFHDLEPTEAISQLEAALGEMTSGDGVVPAAAALVDAAGWSVGPNLFEAAHHLLPAHPDLIQSVLDQVGAWTSAASSPATLYLGPPFTDHTSWAPLLAAAESAKAGATSGAAHFDLRGAPETALADLSAVTAAVEHYTADLRDDGTNDLAALLPQIDAIVGRIRALRGDGPLVLVGHSTAGLAAVAYAAAHPHALAGLITVGTPHDAAPLTTLQADGSEDGLRAAARLLESTSGPLRDALTHLLAAADGWSAPPTPGAAAPLLTYPIKAFAGGAPTDTGGVPALALAGQLPEEPVATLAASIGKLVTGSTRAAPTHLGFGIRARLPVPPTRGAGVAVDAGVRLDIARIRLEPAAPEPATPAHRLDLEIRIERPGAWLLPTANVPSARLRFVELGLTLAAGPQGQVVATPRALLHEAGFECPSVSLLEIDDSTCELVLGALMRDVSPAGQPGSDPIGALTAAFLELGVAVPDPAGGVALAADAWLALRTDAATFLAPRVAQALGKVAAFVGLGGPLTGPWSAAIADLPLVLTVEPSPWRVRLATSANGLALGDALSLEGSLAVPIPSFAAASEVALVAGAARLELDSAAATLRLTPGDWGDPVTIVPAPPVGELSRALGELVPVALVSSVVAVGLEKALGPGVSIRSIAGLIRAPGAWLRRPDSLGAGPNLDPDRIATLLEAIAQAAGLTYDKGIHLPGGLVLLPSGPPLALTLTTVPPLAIPGPAGVDGSLAIGLSATFDEALHIQPGGDIVLTVPLGGTWGGVVLELGLEGGAVSLRVTPKPAGATTLQPIVLLPRFGGLGPLAADGAAALLPAILDGILAASPPSATTSPLRTAALAVADALGIHGGSGDASFTAHTAELQALLTVEGFEKAITTALPTALATVWSAAALPGSVTALASGARFDLAHAGGPTFVATVGFGPSPAISLGIDTITAGPVQIDGVQAGWANGAIAIAASAAVSLPPEATALLGLDLRPGLQAALAGDKLAIDLLPLGVAASADLEIALLPAWNVKIGAGGPLGLLEQIGLPIVTGLLVRAVGSAGPLWSNGPTLATLLRDAEVLAADAKTAIVPFPDPRELLRGVLVGVLSHELALPLTDALKLVFVADASTTPRRLGVGLSGSVDIPAGNVVFSLRFGEPGTTWFQDGAPGVRLLLLDDNAPLTLHPELRLAPFGLRCKTVDGTALVDTAIVHLGSVGAYLWLDLLLEHATVTTRGLGGGLELSDLGIPLGSVAGSGTNPVAASLLNPGSDGKQQTSGQAATPALGFDLLADRRPESKFSLSQVADGNVTPFSDRPIWIGVHREFGPIAVDQIGFAVVKAEPNDHDQTESAEIVFDGGVHISGLAVDVQELSLRAHLDKLAEPASWTLDLQGLAVSLDAGPVSLAGGLAKKDGATVEYDGVVLVSIAGKGISALGSYARPADYTSLFVFLSLLAPLGGPPFLFVTGIGAGAGYNRKLILPDDPAHVPAFPLVQTMDGAFAGNPGKALETLSVAMPPERGAMWLAAGVRFTSWALIRTTAVAYVSLDRGLEIGLLGVSTMELPPAQSPKPSQPPKQSTALVSIELALRARYSSEEALLSIQAQLTDNSWLLSKECQLTGGFAFVVWFRTGEFVLTLGGYHPAFVRPAAYPVVPRLGFHWVPADHVVLKGESYFALTGSCVMAGGRLEAAYDNNGIGASFVVYADFLISWDPFHYDIDAGVRVSAGFSIRICFIGCVTISVHVSIGASVHITGPPFYGEAEIDLEVCSFKVAFGTRPAATPSFIGWSEFSTKHLQTDPADPHTTAAHAGAGLLEPSSDSVSGAAGSAGNPWRFSGDFSLTTETRLPATSWWWNGAVPPPVVPPVVRDAIAIAPMNLAGIQPVHDVTLLDAGRVPVAQSALLQVTAISGPIPIAIWVIQSDPPPASPQSVIQAITGLKITGTSMPSGIGSDIRIGELADFETRTPLGLDPAVAPSTVRVLSRARTQARKITLPQLAASGASLLESAAQILGPAGTEARLAAGVPGDGLSPLALHALLHRRSAPPLIAPLTSGLGKTTRPRRAQPMPRRPEPPVPARRSVALETMLRSPLPPDGAADAQRRTTVDPRHADLPRTVPARAGGGVPALQRLARRSDAAATRPPRRGHRLIARDDRTPLDAGETRIWKLAERGLGTCEVSGTAAARIVFFDEAGLIVSDTEVVAGRRHIVEAPPLAARVAVTCLGEPPASLNDVSGHAAMALGAAPAGRAPACGWQDQSLIYAIGRGALVARGAGIRVGRPLRPRRHERRALAPASSLLAGQDLVETRFPLAVETVLVQLDRTSADSPSTTPRIAATGAELATPPQVVVSGNRLQLLYEVSAREAEVAWLDVAVRAPDGWRLAGVVGLPGGAASWASQFADGTPGQLVPDEPLSARGQITVLVHDEEMP